MEAGRLKRPRANWTRTILICGKCSKKIGGGFGPKRHLALAKALRRFLGVKKGRRASVGIVETKCLGICPKNAVTLVDAGAPGEWSLVYRGTPVAEVARALDLSFPAE